ncbi:MAG: hypothetical protein NXH86_05520 [Flavobacteriaceae bacterium]|uniref:hypothetical protein n=1 Tax=Flagellimonas sp. SN16 TaxID=3415142 RepID=UPI003C4E17AD|nr:hypothetical protein [Flavobacteriaceae bacterium]
MKSKFLSDLSKEKQLAPLLDFYYQKHLQQYAFERVSNLKQQRQGIDLILEHKTSKNIFYVDEKAQLDYVNESLPTFAFELFYHKNGYQKHGWLFDNSKKTHFYALVTSIFSDEEKMFTSCNITFVNRKKLIGHLVDLNLTEEHLTKVIRNNAQTNGKLILEKLHPKKEGFLFFSKSNKAEKPINLVLRLEFLIEIGVAKRLV